MKMIARNSIIGAALLSGCISLGAQAPNILLPPSPPGSERPFLGRWKVQFANGVKEVVRISSDRTALVSEPERNAAGSTEVRDGSLFISYKDDRAERWTVVGDRCVVEHWFPASSWSTAAPVFGIADRVSEAESVGWWFDPTRDRTRLMVQSYFRWNEIPTNSVLEVGMKLDEFIEVLGEPIKRYHLKNGQLVGPEYEGQVEDWVEWQHIPKGKHVAPFINARLENGVVKELVAGEH